MTQMETHTVSLVMLLKMTTLLEKEMAAHSSIFAWKSPWTEEPGGLQSMGYMTEHVCTRVEGTGLVAIK